ncbi:hypothetical protein GWI33_012504 [Rhynchophorus ferrugineus]|uniref:Uncharacterized protein n=1 Tax=Rhynchophorus ferrugineus TaxID=354439 RepID=A0A834M8Q2_RHYFE|nr:hypothetical protein GWI33_012504 [Rhynchophorus ferrugineus]
MMRNICITSRRRLRSEQISISYADARANVFIIPMTGFDGESFRRLAYGAARSDFLIENETVTRNYSTSSERDEVHGGGDGGGRQSVAGRSTHPRRKLRVTRPRRIGRRGIRPERGGFRSGR